MSDVFLNRVETACPPYDIHDKYVDYAARALPHQHERALFQRMASKAHIAHRYSVLQPADHATERLDGMGFYDPVNDPNTAQRMRLYQDQAFPLAREALDRLNLLAIGPTITHVIITSCTGFYAPGLDTDIIRHYALNPAVERTMIGFMGCNAALHALKMAYHIARSTPAAKILIVNLELCTLHFQNTTSLEKLLSFLLFADGCAASLVSTEPTGMNITGFYAEIVPGTADHITWGIGAAGFDMVLSGLVPGVIQAQLADYRRRFEEKGLAKSVDCWAVHPGGHSVLNATEQALDLPGDALKISRSVLQTFGNVSSATLMFVLKDMLEADRPTAPVSGCALAFGPGMSIEGMSFNLDRAS